MRPEPILCVAAIHNFPGHREIDLENKYSITIYASLAGRRLSPVHQKADLLLCHTHWRTSRLGRTIDHYEVGHYSVHVIRLL